MSEMTMEQVQAAPAETPEAIRKDPVASLAGQLRQASTATLARLRRVHPQHDGRAALFESEWLLQAAGIRPHDSEEQDRWALVLHSLAIAQGRHARGSEFEVGQVLARLRVSDARVKQIVEADAQVLVDLIPRLARRLASAGATIDWWPLVELLLHAGSSREARADTARRRIVREYLRSTGRANFDGALPATDI